MLRRNKEEGGGILDKILVVADLVNGWEQIVAWGVSRSQTGDVIYILNVAGSVPEKGADERAPQKGGQLEDAQMIKRLQDLASLVSSSYSHMQVMTSLTVIPRSKLIQAVVRQVSALGLTRVVLGGATSAAQEGPDAEHWRKLVQGIESRVSSLCLLVLVEEGRLASVRKGLIKNGDPESDTEQSDYGTTPRTATTQRIGRRSSLVTPRATSMSLDGTSRLRALATDRSAQPKGSEDPHTLTMSAKERIEAARQRVAAELALKEQLNKDQTGNGLDLSGQSPVVAATPAWSTAEMRRARRAAWAASAQSYTMQTPESQSDSLTVPGSQMSDSIAESSSAREGRGLEARKSQRDDGAMTPKIDEELGDEGEGSDEKALCTPSRIEESAVEDSEAGDLAAPKEDGAMDLDTQQKGVELTAASDLGNASVELSPDTQAVSTSPTTAGSSSRTRSALLAWGMGLHSSLRNERKLIAGYGKQTDSIYTGTDSEAESSPSLVKGSRSIRSIRRKTRKSIHQAKKAIGHSWPSFIFPQQRVSPTTPEDAGSSHQESMCATPANGTESLFSEGAATDKAVVVGDSCAQGPVSPVVGGASNGSKSSTSSATSTPRRFRLAKALPFRGAEYASLAESKGAPGPASAGVVGRQHGSPGLRRPGRGREGRGWTKGVLGCSKNHPKVITSVTIDDISELLCGALWHAKGAEQHLALEWKGEKLSASTPGQQGEKEAVGAKEQETLLDAPVETRASAEDEQSVAGSEAAHELSEKEGVPGTAVVDNHGGVGRVMLWAAGRTPRESREGAEEKLQDVNASPRKEVEEQEGEEPRPLTASKAEETEAPAQMRPQTATVGRTQLSDYASSREMKRAALEAFYRKHGQPLSKGSPQEQTQKHMAPMADTQRHAQYSGGRRSVVGSYGADRRRM